VTLEYCITLRNTSICRISIVPSPLNLLVMLKDLF
jgi:hypothetical protein